MKRSLIIAGLMGLLLTGETAQARETTQTKKISSMQVGELQREYKRATTNEAKLEILKKLNDGGYPAVAAEIIKAEKLIGPSATVAKAQDVSPEITQQSDEALNQLLQKLDTLVTQQQKAEQKATDERRKAEQEKQRLEEEKKKLEEQKRQNEENEKALAEKLEKEKDEQEKKKLEEQQLQLNAEKERLAKEQREIEKQERKRQQEELKREEQRRKEAEQRLAEQERLRRLEEEERQKQLKAEQKRLLEEEEKAKTAKIREEELEREEEEKRKNEEERKISTAVTYLTDRKNELTKALEMAKTEENIKTIKQLIVTAKNDDQVKLYQDNDTVKAQLAELDKLNKQADAKLKEITDAAKKGKGEASELAKKEAAKGSGSDTLDPNQERLDNLLDRARGDTLDPIQQKKAEYLAVKTEIARINGIVEKNAEKRRAASGSSSVVTVKQEDFTDPETNKNEFEYYKLLVKKQHELYKIDGVGRGLGLLKNSNWQDTYYGNDSKDSTAFFQYNLNASLAKVVPN